MMRGAGRGPLAALLIALAFAVPAYGADHGWPGSDPSESVRVHTPDDPEFDCAEPDDEDGGTCTNVFDEQTARFGFAPSATRNSATYLNDASTATQAIERQNAAAGRNARGQGSGVSADQAWKLSAGDPRVKIAILDTGIRWENRGLVDRIALNRGELPKPVGCSDYDCNGDGAFNVEDYAHDPRVSKSAGDAPADSILDASDLIAAFSDGSDADGNGYLDDIAGWDFFNDDNDPFDAVELLEREQPRHGPRRRRRGAGERRRRRPRCLPALPDPADARVGHVRGGHEQLRPGGHVRGRQRREGGGGRSRRPVQLALRAAGVRVRVLEGHAACARVVGPQHGRPQLPDRLRPVAVRRRHGGGHAGRGHGAAGLRGRRELLRVARAHPPDARLRHERAGAAPGSATRAPRSTADTLTS